MHRLGTGLVVAAVLGVGVAAAVDALPEKESPLRSGSTPLSPGLVQALQKARVSGLVTYSDRGCRLHARRLPTLRVAKAPTIESCEPHISTAGIGTWKGDVVWSGLGYQTVQVVLSRRALGQAVRPALGFNSGQFRAHQAVVLGEGRYAVLAESDEREGERFLAIFEGKQLRFITVTEAEALRSSPQGAYVALFRVDDALVGVFRRGGGRLPLPALSKAHAIAWSPDERWTAVATRESVHLFPTENPAGPIIRLPLAVRDLDWSA
jgi:hypothetical protein